MFEWLRNTTKKLFDWLDSIVEWAYKLLLDVLLAAWDIITDAFIWAIEQCLSVVQFLLSQLDLSGLQGYSSAWGSLPSEIINALGLLGIGEASLIILASIAIRLILQLIPFVRLGS